MVRPMLIGGAWRASGPTMSVSDPESGHVVDEVACATGGDALRALDRGVDATRVARALPTHQRATVLAKTADVVDSAAATFAQTIATEGIKTIREARAEVARCVMTLRLAAEEAQRIPGETITFGQRPGSERRHGYVIREPVGLVLAITPFNDPLNLVAHKIAPAIAAGNAVILKPHEKTPLSALLLTEALLQAGLPEDVLQVLPGRGAELGPVLLSDDRVRLVSFTGGLETGRQIAALAGVKRLELELGSNCPTIVLADADLDRAADACIAGAFWAAGQNCLHVQRVIVERSIYGAMRERLVDRASRVRAGAKLDEASDMGCLVDDAAAARIKRLVESAMNGGADLLGGGQCDGRLFEPTLIERVPQGHPLLQDEIYGPVTALIAADDLDDALRIANDTAFGLQAGIFTRDLDAAHRAIQDLDVGAVMINDSSDYRLDAMPFGGVKLSGLGREGVRSSILAMTEPKVACFNLLAG
jgi:glyceraldehyde-3-phosphate dehydrogenase (NADP+)